MIGGKGGRRLQITSRGKGQAVFSFRGPTSEKYTISLPPHLPVADGYSIVLLVTVQLAEVLVVCFMSKALGETVQIF